MRRVTTLEAKVDILLTRDLPYFPVLIILATLLATICDGTVVHDTGYLLSVRTKHQAIGFQSQYMLIKHRRSVHRP